ncbi:MAG: pyridoxal kinase PdxY [Alphaproteobacteria bacterium]|nr:pyridoxal kinase PdxY [Alphaproteobacteria bacterium]
MAILSIQSHVAYGHVGNAAATFPLQRLGREVWAVHTVMFAAHAGYGPPKGPVFPAQTIRDVVSGLEDLRVLPRCTAILSGYLGDAHLGDAVLGAVAKVKQANPSALYCCDPVMGDAAPGIYVRDNIPGFMKERAIPAADIATPNAFEMTLLTGIAVTDIASALAGCRALLALGPKLVLLTSLEGENTAAGYIEMLVATQDAAWLVATPKLDLTPAPNGAGDLTSALFLAFYLETHRPDQALTRTAAAVHAVFAATQEAGTRELAILDAQDDIVRPKQHFSAKLLT